MTSLTKSLDLKLLRMNTYKKPGGAPLSFGFHPLPFAFCRGVAVMQYSAACNICKTFPQGGVAARNDPQAVPGAGVSSRHNNTEANLERARIRWLTHRTRSTRK